MSNVLSLNFTCGYKALNREGALLYEYNPLKVYRDTDGNLQDLITDGEDGLNFDLSHPVDIVTLPSYDGSVNLILNDGKNKPKLINTRFSVKSSNTYKIVDREGNQDTNIYDKDHFLQDASLFKSVNSIPKLDYLGLSSDGSLLCGNYHFYFKLCDADGNESDFVAESSVVSCHMGSINDPFSIRGGIENENSFKSANFRLYNIDSAYSYVIVYYTRSTSDGSGLSVTTSLKVLKKYSIYGGIASILITGYETVQHVSEDELNLLYSLVDSVQTLVECSNMLFFGNIQKPEIPYKELQDLSLRITPHLYDGDDIGRLDHDYYDRSTSTNKYEYYNTFNIYYRLGYHNDEMYRLGIVYIMPDGSLSPVFNVRGHTNLRTDTVYDDIPVYNENSLRHYINIDKTKHLLENQDENSKGVIKIHYNGNLFAQNKTIPIGLRFEIDPDAFDLLKGITKGFFFVRLKRLKLTLCQALTIGTNKSGNYPTIPILDEDRIKYVNERFITDDLTLVHDYSKRIQLSEESYINKGYAALCPEYFVNKAFFNQFFTGTNFTVLLSNLLPTCNYFKANGNVYSIDYYNQNSELEQREAHIVSVDDGVSLVRGQHTFYRGVCGESATATKLLYIDFEKPENKASNLIRGVFSSYIGIETKGIPSMKLIDIKIPDYSLAAMSSYLDIRARDQSLFLAISDRYEWNDAAKKTKTVNKKKVTFYEISKVYRGDCFICNFSQRIIRNFQDPTAPINDLIVDENTWKDNYDIKDAVKSDLINRGDVNAVKLGHWVTFKVCSSINLSMRCEDSYNTSEVGLTGRRRSFFPLRFTDTSGEGKIPESSLHNAGYSVTVSSKNYVELADIPAFKNIFTGRLMYSDISAQDAFVNSYRVFRSTNIEDYPLTYGLIVKLIEYSGQIICICEHGILRIPVDELAIIKNVNGNDIFIGSERTLLKPIVLSDCFGTLWKNSVIKTDAGIYGVDTVAKKIWRIALEGSLNPTLRVKTISDFRVLSFLNQNIDLKSSDVTPTIGIRDVKTHYNKFKRDVMFTFYNAINSLQETAWNLCFNESLDTFITFYSWMPSFSENINNIFFSFDRNASKNMARLYCDSSDIYIEKNGKRVNSFTKENSSTREDGFVIVGEIVFKGNIDNLFAVNTDSGNAKQTIEYSISDSSVQNNFKIEGNVLLCNCNASIDNSIYKVPIVAELTKKINSSGEQILKVGHTVTLVYGNINEIVKDKNSFWKHGQSGLYPTKQAIKPTHWYGKTHPFEIEFVVADMPHTHKIFTNLLLIANKSVPESFHFEITGEVYTFADDKENIFFRQEALKNLYQYTGADIVYDDHYKTINPKLRYIPYSNEYDRSTVFPLYYSRVNTINEIEDSYLRKEYAGKDYQRMSGSEIIYDKINGEYRIATHIKACPFGYYYDLEITEEEYLLLETMPGVLAYYDEDKNKYYVAEQYTRYNGNTGFIEDRWDVLIPSIVYRQKNEEKWPKVGNRELPPIQLAINPLPETNKDIDPNISSLPDNLTNLGYDINKSAHFDLDTWEDCLKETRLRDRYLKVRVRYSGDDLTVLYAIKTLYTISYT